MGLLTTRSTRRLATVGGLLTLALVAGAAPAVAAQPPPAPGCAGAGDQAGQGPIARLLAALGVTVTLDVRVAERRAPGQDCPPAPRRSAGYRSSAAAVQNWGEPTRVEEFDGTRLGPAWNVYDGPGHAGNGRRTPSAVSVRDGMLTITGNRAGDTAGMEWGGGQRYGRWEGRVRAPASDPSYNALLLLWPDAEDFPVGGEIDFMEMMDHTRQKTNVFLHYGKNNKQVSGSVVADATQWHNWAVEWTPTSIATYLDGTEWWRTERTEIFPPGPMHLCIQLDWFPRSARGQVKTSTMQVDWVKQYALPPAETGSRAPRGGRH
ncbi:MAG TPA: glycoside hydrolase family 16 protein [Pseudonocardia sp.]|nr:glycoside hydrolase family 16 protein [Pseudonocardia sp.]